MSDEAFSADDIAEYVSTNVPEMHRELVLKALHSSESPADFDEIGLTLTGERTNAGFVFRTGGKQTGTGKFWQAIKDEVYSFICTESQEYREIRLKTGNGFGIVVSAIATQLANVFSLGVGVVTGAVAVALILVYKIGKNAWCNTNKPATV